MSGTNECCACAMQCADLQFVIVRMQTSGVQFPPDLLVTFDAPADVLMTLAQPPVSVYISAASILTFKDRVYSQYKGVISQIRDTFTGATGRPANEIQISDAEAVGYNDTHKFPLFSVMHKYFKNAPNFWDHLTSDSLEHGQVSE